MWAKGVTTTVAAASWGASIALVAGWRPGPWFDEAGSQQVGAADAHALLLVNMTLLAIALAATAILVVGHRQRPLGQAYELGYMTGRRDAIRDINRSGDNVRSLRRQAEQSLYTLGDRL